jgi:hypothetical protein
MFTRSFWINVVLLAILIIVLSWWIMYLYTTATVTATAYLVKYLGNIE